MKYSIIYSSKMKWYKGLENWYAHLMQTPICIVYNRLMNDTERRINTFKLNNIIEKPQDVW